MKKIISTVLCISIVFSLFTFLPTAVSAETVSGTCGDGLTWELNTTTGAFTISGTGDMFDYSSLHNGGPSITAAPWNSYVSTVTTVEINIGVTSIGDRAFLGCASIVSVTIPDSVTSIGEWAFCDCASLENVTIPDSVTSIGNSAFSRCTSITSVNIPDSVKSIGYGAFDDCTSLENVNIPDSVTSMGSAFARCSSLQYNTYDNAQYLGNASNPYIVLIKASNKDIESCVINDNTKFIHTSAFYGCTSIADIIIPDSVISIGAAFGSCSSLKSITIPDSVTSIAEGTFNFCTSLESVTIPDSVTSIGSEAFYRCSSLESVTIPNNVTSIEVGTFLDCTSLKSVTIPSSVTSIQHFAFYGCTSLTDTYYYGTQEQWNAITIESYNNPLYKNIHFNYGGTVNDHDYTTVTVPATCTVNGYTTYTCTKCGDTFSITIPALGHSFETNYTFDIQPDEYTVGLKSKHCIRCDATIHAVEVEYLPGDADCDGVVTAKDIREIKYALVGLNEDDHYAVNNADFDDDGIVTSNDIRLLKRMLVS
ncbi:MAG: leucine-rich repeat protein [Clostridia bacterium]|nr:leucine-rich repeat protein [Clostridia bacterium]